MFIFSSRRVTWQFIRSVLALLQQMSLELLLQNTATKSITSAMLIVQKLAIRTNIHVANVGTGLEFDTDGKKQAA